MLLKVSLSSVFKEHAGFCCLQTDLIWREMAVSLRAACAEKAVLSKGATHLTL